jgi:MoaA/NifB/PqqE/SkfB family radical SAM enzyme
MERVDIKVGFYCNNQCAFCVQGRKRDILPAKDIEEVRKSLAEARELGKTEVVLTGGEPTMHPQFLDLVKIARDLGFVDIQIQTNGRMFAYLDFCMKTIEAGATQFSPALHGSSSEIHDFLTDAEGSFMQTIQGIKNLKRLGQYVLTNTVITSKNYQDLPDIARIFVDLGVDQFQFAFVHILGTADKNKDWLVPRKSDIAPFVREGLEIGKVAGKKVTAEAIPYCLMQGCEDCVAEAIMPKTRIYDAGFVVSDYGDYRANNGKAKRKECLECKYNDICEGPWKEYIDIYGWDEFKPVT